MLVTLLGIVIFVSPEHPLNAELPMLVTLLGIIVVWHPRIRILLSVSIIALQLSRLSYFVFPEETIMLASLLQP